MTHFNHSRSRERERFPSRSRRTAHSPLYKRIYTSRWLHCARYHIRSDPHHTILDHPFCAIQIHWSDHDPSAAVNDLSSTPPSYLRARTACCLLLYPQSWAASTLPPFGTPCPPLPFAHRAFILHTLLSRRRTNAMLQGTI